MRFRDMTLRLVRSVSVCSCLWLGVLTAAAQQRVAQPVGGQMQASSSDANRANAVNMAMPGELPESPGAVHAQELGSKQPMQAQSSAAAEPQSPTSQSSQSEPAQPPSQTVQPSQTAPVSLLLSPQESPLLQPNSAGFGRSSSGSEPS